MKKSLLSLLFLFILNISFGQCFFGFEHINTAQNDSALVIHKYGFPNYTDFTLYQDNNNGWIIDTTLSNQTSDTLIFGTHADTLGTFKLYGISSAGDTLGFAKSGVFPSSCFPELFVIKDYNASTSISASDGSMVIGQINNGSSLQVSGGATIQDDGDSILVSDLTEGYKVSFYVDVSGFDSLYVNFLIGDPSDWANIQSGTMTCPIGINLATDQSICDGEAYIGQVQNGVAPYTYDWNGTGTFGVDTTIAGLCVGNHSVTIQDQNGDIRTCAFAMGSEDSGYFPPTQTSDTTIHTFTDYCIDPDVDSISVIGSEIIDSVSASVVWSFFDGSVLIDQLLDTFQFTIPNGNYNSIELHTHLVCNGDTLKSTSSVYSTYGYVSLPFSETGFLDVQELDDDVEVNLYPIPFDNFINIDVNTLEIEEIVVLNHLGQEVEVDFNKLSNNHLVADFSSLSKGNYTIKFLTRKGDVNIKKVIKN